MFSFSSDFVWLQDGCYPLAPSVFFIPLLSLLHQAVLSGHAAAAPRSHRFYPEQGAVQQSRGAAAKQSGIGKAHVQICEPVSLELSNTAGFSLLPFILAGSPDADVLFSSLAHGLACLITALINTYFIFCCFIA